MPVTLSRICRNSLPSTMPTRNPSMVRASHDFPEQPHDCPPRIRPHRQEVDDVGPVLADPVAVAHQARGGRVAVEVVADQDLAKVVAGRRACSSRTSEVPVQLADPRPRFDGRIGCSGAAPSRPRE